MARFLWERAVALVMLPDRLAQVAPGDALVRQIDGQAADEDGRRAVVDIKRAYAHALRPSDPTRVHCAVLVCASAGIHRAQGHSYCTEHRGLWLLAGLRHTDKG